MLLVTVLGAASPAPRTFARHVLAWADVRNGYQHESITHALSTIERPDADDVFRGVEVVDER